MTMALERYETLVKNVLLVALAVAPSVVLIVYSILDYLAALRS